ncbi:SAM domain-containing protein [Aphelenchoides bicaudatus]|nr:SAM domain-containing protein [Aphelenchoides bicaudatus]
MPSLKRRFVLISQEEIIRHVESRDTRFKSLLKLAASFIYCSIALFITSFTMVLVHDRVPDMSKYPPLPDLILDSLPYIPGAFEMCEMIGLFMSSIWLMILFFHQHRIIIARRMFSLVGTVFLLRCVTMLLTSLSVPGSHLECKARNFETLKEKLWQAYNIWIHGGMSIQGVRTCGDYLFSGHTSLITLLNHFISEYTPESWHGLHSLIWTLNCFGIFFILAAKEHYSIDVFVAFYISSRLFLHYHNLAYHSQMSNDWRVKYWFPLGWLFESGSIGRVPNKFEIPFIFADDSEESTSIVRTEVEEIVTEDDKSDISNQNDKKIS